MTKLIVDFRSFANAREKMVSKMCIEHQKAGPVLYESQYAAVSLSCRLLSLVMVVVVGVVVMVVSISISSSSSTAVVVVVGQSPIRVIMLWCHQPNFAIISVS
jgi:hypothetical protein